MDLIAAEAAETAAGMAAAEAGRRNGSAVVEWEVWDPEEDAVGMGMGMAVAGMGPTSWAPTNAVAVAASASADRGPMTWSPADLAAAFPPEGSMPAGWLMPPGMLAPPTTTSTTPKPSPPLAAPLDALIDFGLGAVAHQLRANHSTEAPAPDFHKDFTARLGFIKVHGHLEAMGGTVGDLSSLFRDGAATLRKAAGGALVLDAAAGLRTLRLKYRHYSARAGPIRVSGEMQAVASPVSLRAQLWLSPPCRAELRALAVAQVGRVKVQASGLGALRRLLPLLERWMQKRMRGEIERSVLPQLERQLNAQLKRLVC